MKAKRSMSRWCNYSLIVRHVVEKFEVGIKTVIHDVVDTSSKNLKVQSKTFDAIDVGHYLYVRLLIGQMWLNDCPLPWVSGRQL